MKKVLLLLVAVLLLGAACTGGQGNKQQPTNEDVIIENNTAVATGTDDIGEANTPEPVKQADQKKPQVIGGDKDGYGCLGPAGYSRDDELRVCVKAWETKDTNIRRAIKLAVDYYKPWYSLTVVSVTPGAAEGSYSVVLEAYGERTTVNIENWQVKL